MSVEQQERIHVGGVSAPTGSHRLIAWARSVPPDVWAMLAIAAAVVLANLPYLLDLFEANPFGPGSGLVRAATPGLLRGSGTLDANNALISQALGHRAALDLLHFRLPLWNSYEATGAPLAGEMQSAALFPPTLLTAVGNGQLYEHMLLEILGGVSTYLLLRRISVNRWVGVAAAIAFALNGASAWFQDPNVNPVSFLPVLLLGVELAYAATIAGRRGGWWLIAVAGALSGYAGFPEIAYINALMAICWFAWRCGCVGRERLTAFAGKAAAGAIVGTLLAAPLLIASIDFFNHGYTSLHETGYYGSQHIVSQGLPQLLLPYVYGPIDGFADPKLVLPTLWATVGGFLSTSLLLFALLGSFSKGRRGLRLTLLAWIVLASARIYGVPVLGHVFGVLPGMSRMAFYRYAFPSLELAVIVLAALGLGEVARARGEPRRVVWAVLASLSLVALAAIGARSLADQLGGAERPYYIAAVIWGAAIVVAGGVAALVRSSRFRTWLITLLVAVDAVALFALPELSAARAMKTDLAPVAFLRRHLGNSRFFTLGPLQPNYGAYFGIASLNVNDIPVPTNFAHYVRAHLDPWADPIWFVGYPNLTRWPGSPAPQEELLKNLADYRASGVAYVLTKPGQALPQGPTTFELVFRSPTTWIYHLAGAAPYFTSTNPGCIVSAERRGAARLTCPATTTLIRRETYLPGSSAQVDGHPVPVRQVNGLFQAVTVGPGSHRVTFSYLPPNLILGFVGFAAGCAWLLLASATGRRRRGWHLPAVSTRRPPSQTPSPTSH